MMQYSHTHCHATLATLLAQPAIPQSCLPEPPLAATKAPALTASPFRHALPVISNQERDVRKGCGRCVVTSSTTISNMQSQWMRTPQLILPMLRLSPQSFPSHKYQRSTHKRIIIYAHLFVWYWGSALRVISKPAC